MTSSECIGAVTYYRELVVMMLAPIIAFAVCAICYLLPSHFDLLCFRHQTLQSKTRTRMKFWKLFLYCLFLIYPSLSSTVLREFVCISIDDTQWLLTNLRVQCYTSDWYLYSYISVPFIALYPVGIPLFFFVLLASNRRALHERRVQAQLGFLYASYQRQLWWWEILDSMNKLFLTSVLAFFPSRSQLPLAMACLSAYTMAILVLQPFLSPSDDLLQLLALTELFMLCLAGWIYFNTTDATLDSTQDTFVSVCLIAITILFFFMFALALLWAMRKIALKLYGKWQSSRLVQKDRDALAKLEDDRNNGGKQRNDSAPVEGKAASKEAALMADTPTKPTYRFSIDGRSPNQLSARVAPSAVPPLTGKKERAAEDSGSDSGAGSDSGSGDSESDDSGDEVGGGSKNEQRAKSPSAGTKPGSGRHTARSVSSLAKDAWSVPATPKSTSQVLPMALLRQPSKLSAGLAAVGSEAPSPRSPSKIAQTGNRSPRPAQPPIAEEREHEAEEKEREDEGKGQVEAEEKKQPSPTSPQLPSAPRLGTGADMAAAPRYELPPVVRPSRASVDGGAAVGRSPAPVMRTLTLAPLGMQPQPQQLSGKKKKRKFVRAGDNFAQGQAATNRIAVANPLKQLFTP